MSNLKKLFYLIKDYKKKIYFLTLLIGIGSILELASLGILVPAISYFLDGKVFYPEIFNTIDKEYYIYILLSVIFLIFISKTIFANFDFKTLKKLIKKLSNSKTIFANFDLKPLEKLMRK